jgi:hypothetical protein
MMKVQIYEIQNPEDARLCVDLEVNRATSRAGVGDGKEDSRRRAGFSVMLGRMRIVLYNDHIGAPPFVGFSVKIRPLREAFSFLSCLASWTVIILCRATPVNSCWQTPAARSPFSQCDRSASASTPVPFNLAGICPISTKQCGL